MNIPASFFGDLSVEDFLSDYWQKKPLLVRNAWPDFESPLSPEAFMELSSREDALSRMIVEKGGSNPWEMREGPFSRSDFDETPDSHWTLLIQEVDRLVPEVRSLLQVVSFLPKWRLDDVMISYAANGGGVGAHIDNYDVFLLQGLGQRQWQINTVPVEEEVLVEGIDVSILADFEPDRDWVLNPGDMLYLPPRVAHFGVALGPCMTLSFGCRAPGVLEMVSAVFERALEELDPIDRYQDPNLTAGSPAGKISGEIVSWVKSRVTDLVGDETALAELVGSILSEPRRFVEGASIEDTLDAAFKKGALRPATSSQVLYQVNPTGSVQLFAAGEPIVLGAEALPLVQKLIEGPGLTSEDLKGEPALADLLEELYLDGVLVTG
ncbi:MAG: cupin domain-containing protein [Bacteroidetes Order II. Incertae sedis bacterium]|jgi:50S ribosomal protein L16 3-hydroxylase|nr:cupin domain-containing protein [Bacteroidetes Order II. bacterium]MBT4602002.1 cupin domain-containing protein [Bacteroidetes Order II. bacterium]MBT5249119.1 cupin domain-containing protein [Bacteroidetes Order II. bacterium]MBT6199481.1 cupin domain-containing protein [Bacteroidetes Order II. bacterium]MBT6424995.1 cupin domain-containing protein [Bacteroidetes Order II. bacterium]